MVATKHNPADILTRLGVPIREFNNNKLWWQGPNFMKNNDIQGDVGPIDVNEISTIEELKKVTPVLISVNDNTKKANLNEVMNIEKFSQLNRLVRTTAWVYRFCRNMKSIINKTPMLLESFLTPNELRHAEENWSNKINLKGFLHKK